MEVHAPRHFEVENGMFTVWECKAGDPFPHRVIIRKAKDESPAAHGWAPRFQIEGAGRGDALFVFESKQPYRRTVLSQTNGAPGVGFKLKHVLNVANSNIAAALEAPYIDHTVTCRGFTVSVARDGDGHERSMIFRGDEIFRGGPLLPVIMTNRACGPNGNVEGWEQQFCFFRAVSEEERSPSPVSSALENDIERVVSSYTESEKITINMRTVDGTRIMLVHPHQQVVETIARELQCSAKLLKIDFAGLQIMEGTFEENGFEDEAKISVFNIIRFFDKETEERMTRPGYAGPCAHNFTPPPITEFKYRPPFG